MRDFHKNFTIFALTASLLVSLGIGLHHLHELNDSLEERLYWIKQLSECRSESLILPQEWTSESMCIDGDFNTVECEKEPGTNKVEP